MPCTPPARTSLRALFLLPLLFAWHAATAQPTESLVIPKEPDKSYAIPIAEIIGFDLALSNFNRAFGCSSDYDVSGRSIRRKLSLSFGPACGSLVTGWYIAELPQTDRIAMISALHHAFLTLGLLTIASSLAFWTLRPGDGDSVSKGSAVPDLQR